MDIKEYFFAIGDYLDENFEHPSPEMESKFYVILEQDIPSYYERNISTDMAAEFVAQKLELTRVVNG